MQRARYLWPEKVIRSFLEKGGPEENEKKMMKKFSPAS